MCTTERLAVHPCGIWVQSNQVFIDRDGTVLGSLLSFIYQHNHSKGEKKRTNPNSKSPTTPTSSHSHSFVVVLSVADGGSPSVRCDCGGPFLS